MQFSPSFLGPHVLLSSPICFLLSESQVSSPYPTTGRTYCVLCIVYLLEGRRPELNGIKNFLNRVMNTSVLWILYFNCVTSATVR